MTAFASARPGVFARFALAFVALIGLASCGGGVSGPSTPVNSGPLSISPPDATLYADLPFTFVVTGGTGSYIVTSSDQLALPVAGTITGNVFTVVPGPVAADTAVTLSVRDTGTATPITTTLTVKPRTVSNTVTITPSATQSAACGTAVCAGGDAEVRVVLSQSGLPLRNREVRFDVVSGEFRIISSAPGEPETLSLSGTTFTDESGTARMRVRVLPDALSQTALLQITDLSSGFTQRTSFAIAPSSNAPLNAQPSTIVFQGVAANTCASGISADVIVFGGRPPYQISRPGSFEVSPTVVSQSGGRFTVTATGQCSAGSQIAVVDSNGATVTVTASNKLSDAEPIDPPPAPFAVSPASVTLTSCNSVANVAMSGGSGTYFGASGDTRVTVKINGSLASIQRTAPSADIPGGPTVTVTVTLTDGQVAKPVTVRFSGTGADPCL